MNHRVIGITGWKNSGKTTLVENLVATFVAQGLRIATIKHAHHTFDIDQKDTDSYRHRKAGAHEVAIVSSNRWALMHELEDEKEPPLQEVLRKLSSCDLVIVEGYKREGHDKIEVRRNVTPDNEPLALDDNSIIAIASDMLLPNEKLPVLALQNTEKIAAFILTHVKLAKTTVG
jgi:molybdopterin-guanine dinucleotide biosynthesis adapter protein